MILESALSVVSFVILPISLIVERLIFSKEARVLFLDGDCLKVSSF